MTDKLDSVFNAIARNNSWGSTESVSGPGSTLDSTRHLRQMLVQLFSHLNIRSIVDAPCGDMNWMKQVQYPFESFVGVDIVPAIIQWLQSQPFPESYEFRVGNIVTDILPRADVIFCRDCLVHLPFAAIQQAVQQWKLAGFTYVFATTFPGWTQNSDIHPGDWRALNMEIAPFNWGKPLLVIDELAGVAPPYHDKSIGVWELKNIG